MDYQPNLAQAKQMRAPESTPLQEAKAIIRLPTKPEMIKHQTRVDSLFDRKLRSLELNAIERGASDEEEMRDGWVDINGEVPQWVPPRECGELIQGYQIRERLGCGSYGKAFVATKRNPWMRGPPQIAVKFAPKIAGWGTPDERREGAGKVGNDRRIFERESTALQTLMRIGDEQGHPNVMKLYWVSPQEGYNYAIDQPFSDTKYPCYVFMQEWCEGMELFNVLQATTRFSFNPKNPTDPGFDPKDGDRVPRSYFKQLIDGLKFCHDAGIAHRDLKPENILLDSQNRLKIIDFGLAGLCGNGYQGPTWDKNLTSSMTTNLGSQAYKAPEVFQFGANRIAYDVGVDLWAAGVILFILIEGVQPVSQANGNDWWFEKLQRKNRRGYELFWAAHDRTNRHGRPSRFSPDAKDFIQGIMDPDPKTRLREHYPAEDGTCSGRCRGKCIRKHPWFTGPTDTHPNDTATQRYGNPTDPKWTPTPEEAGAILQARLDEPDVRRREVVRKHNNMRIGVQAALDKQNATATRGTVGGGDDKKEQDPDQPRSGRAGPTDSDPPRGDDDRPRSIKRSLTEYARDETLPSHKPGNQGQTRSEVVKTPTVVEPSNYSRDVIERRKREAESEKMSINMITKNVVGEWGASTPSFNSGDKYYPAFKSAKEPHQLVERIVQAVHASHEGAKDAAKRVNTSDNAPKPPLDIDNLQIYVDRSIYRICIRTWAAGLSTDKDLGNNLYGNNLGPIQVEVTLSDPIKDEDKGSYIVTYKRRSGDALAFGGFYDEQVRILADLILLPDTQST